MEKDKPVEQEWVIGRYKGDPARSKKAHADNGIGYFVRSEQGRGDSYAIEVAFLRPKDSPKPEHLLLADSIQIKKLDVLYRQRHDVRDEQQMPGAASTNKSEIGSIIRSQGLRAYYDKMQAEKRKSM